MKRSSLRLAAVLLMTAAYGALLTGCAPPSSTASDTNAAMTEKQKAALLEHKKKQDQFPNQ